MILLSLQYQSHPIDAIGVVHVVVIEFCFVFVSLFSSHLSEARIIQGFISSFSISFLFDCFFPFVSFVPFFKYLCVCVCVCVCVCNRYFTHSLHRSLGNRSPALSFLMCVFMAVIVLVLISNTASTRLVFSIVVITEMYSNFYGFRL